jgi:hypothetical protein
MSATLCEEPVQLRSELSLEELLGRAYEDVQVHGVADCPVCGGVIDACDVDAICASCGSRLS